MHAINHPKLVTHILLALDGMHFVGEYYAGEFDPTDPILSPVFADINNFPETLIQVCSNELLYNDAIEFTKKLREKGTKYLCFLNSFYHDFYLKDLAKEKGVLIYLAWY